LESGGTLLASDPTRQRSSLKKFLSCCEVLSSRQDTGALAEHFAPQPPDFPSTRTGTGPSESVWLQVE